MWWCVAVCDVVVCCWLHDCLHFEHFACLHLGLLDPEVEGKKFLKMSVSTAPLTQHHISETCVLSESCENVTTHSFCSCHHAVTNVKYILHPVEFQQINDCFMFHTRIIQWST